MEDLVIIRLNIERYFRLLEREKDPTKRHQIVTLLQKAVVEEARGASLQEESSLRVTSSVERATVFQPPVPRSKIEMPS